MKKAALEHLPQMRKEGLVIDELPDEILVYDLERHKAHCLNQTSALVWKNCDGASSAAEIAARIQKEMMLSVTEEMVWVALAQLEKLHLLEERIALPPALAGMTRREMVRRLGIATAVALPLVTTIIAPTPAQAFTCAGSGQACGDIACCSGLLCVNGTCQG